MPHDPDHPRPPRPAWTQPHEPWRGPVIGVVRTPYGDKFGAPRQPGLATAAEGRIVLRPPFDREEALRGLDQCTHLWLIYGFHRVAVPDETARLTVRPPRLGGNERLGVFATRSPFRPHPLGLSVVRLLSVHPGREGSNGQRGHLHVAGVDLVDGTPLLDIKPYLPWADSVADARCAWAPAEPVGLADAHYSMTPNAEAELRRVELRRPGFAELLEQTLRADPRPSYHAAQSSRVYRLTLDGVQVGWRVDESGIQIVEASGEGAG